MMQDFHLRKEKDKKEGARSTHQVEWYSLHAEGYGLQVRKKRAATKKPTGTPSSSSAAQTPCDQEARWNDQQFIGGARPCCRGYDCRGAGRC